jgi:hemerythrin-like domain-containing protein
MTATEALEAIRAFGEHEHLDLARGLDLVHDSACAVGVGSRIDTVRAIGDVLRWSEATLEPHIAWEESWLYPQIDALTQTPWATRAARFDHRQIRSLASRLRQDRALCADGLAPADEVRGHLFAYEALLRTHIDREEHLLLPVLAGEGVSAIAGWRRPGDAPDGPRG